MIELNGKSVQKINRASQEFLELRKFRDRIAHLDSSLWGEGTEAPQRLGWVNAPLNSRSHLSDIADLVEKFSQKQHLVLSGMGGSSLAPEVIAATYKKKLLLLDSTDPDYIAGVLRVPLRDSVIVISSKSGSTIETASHKALIIETLKESGLNPADHMVIVTDPKSPLDVSARNEGLSVINADPAIGGRFSALSAFGLVPAALLGIDVTVLLQAADVADQQIRSSDVAVDLAYLLLFGTEEYFTLADSAAAPGLSDWIEQLVAESTGKSGVGRMPIVKRQPTGDSSSSLIVGLDSGEQISIFADLPSHFLLWEWATAILGAALAIDPFNQPNVTEAKVQTNQLLKEWAGVLPRFSPIEVAHEIEIFGTGLTELLSAIPIDGYLAIMAYLNPHDQREVSELRDFMETKIGRPVTFGWGPRFLHSTGQFHKGGPAHGAFLQITGEPDKDLAIPGASYTFGTLEMAQALGDNRALTEHGLPVTRLHLRSRQNAFTQLRALLAR